MPYINPKDWMNNYYEAGEPKPRFGYETYPPLPKIIKKIKRKKGFCIKLSWTRNGMF